jgi:dimethylargininase
MPMFTRAIVKTPCRALVRGISSHPELGTPDYEAALGQHEAYIRALEDCGMAVSVLEPSEEYPDSCFVEDTAVLCEDCAVVTNPGAESRKGETAGIIPALKRFYREDRIYHIRAPGALEGGDVMRVGRLFYVGLSGRTNREGINQFAGFLKPLGFEVVTVPLAGVLHLKTGVNYLSDNHLLVSGEFAAKPEFAAYHRIPIPPEEDYAANCLWLNGTVLIPEGFPRTLGIVKDLGYPVRVTDTSEFRKIDGGLSCLSLRF